MPTERHSLIRSKGLLAAVSAVGCVAAGILVHQFYRAQWNALREEKASELAAIAEVKAAAIASWRRERLGDIRAVSRNAALGRSVRDLLRSPSPDDEAKLRGWLENLDSPDGDTAYLLFDLAGKQRFASSVVSRAVRDGGQRLAMAAAREGRLLVDDFQILDADLIQIAAAAPLVDEKGQVIGAVSIHINPRRWFYKLIQSWPTSSRTAESLLVRRDGTEIILLSELRHRGGTALKLKAPLVSPDLALVTAVAGRDGILTGTDYRGEAVLAALKRIPDSPWFLVAKIDHAEIAEVARSRTAYFGAVAVLVILICGFTLMLAWSRSEFRHYRQLYEAETQHRAVVSHYEQIHQHANDIMLLVDQTGRIVEANERAVQNYGYPRAELMGKHIRDLRAAPTLTALDMQWNAAGSDDGLVFETVHRRSSGSTFPVEVSSRVIRVDGQEYRQSIVRDISERKRAEQQLLDARSRLETALEIAGLGPAELDPKTGNLVFSARACAIFGFDQPAQPQDAWFDRILPADRDRVRAEVQAAIARNAPASIEYRFVRPDGEVRWASAKGISVTAPDGLKKRFSVTQDITDRKRADQALRDSEQRFRAAFEHAAVGMLVLDADGALRSVNEIFCRMLQYRADELVGKHFQDITHPGDRQIGADMARRLIAGELTHAAFEKRYIRKDGSVLWALVSSAVLRDGPGMATEFITQVQDVTKRKQAEEALREKSARLEELTGALNLSHAIVTSPLGVIRYWSRGAAAIYGWTAEEAIGQSAAELLQTEFPCPPEEIRAHLENSGEWQGELRQHRRDGQTVAVASHWSLQRDDQGQAAAIIEVDNDITALKRTEEALRVAHRERERDLAQLESVLNHLTEGIIVSDLEGRLIHWNPAALALHGFASLDECHRRVPEFLDLFEVSTAEGTVPVHDWPIPRILRGETLRGFEARLRRRSDNWERVFSYAGSLVRDGNGTPLLAVLSITDVTAARAAEAALREREADLNRAQAVAKMGSWRLDRRTGEFHWSDESYRLFGVPPGATVTRESFLSAVHPDDLGILDQFREASLRGEGYNTEYRIVVGGEVKWVRGQGEVEFDAAGKLVSGFGTVQDITRSREEEDAMKQALAEAEAGRRLLNAMMEHIPLGIAVSDAGDPGVVYVSRYARDLVQRPIEETADSGTWRSPGAPGAAADDEIPLARARKQGEVVREEEWLLTRKDGGLLPVLATAAPIRDAENRIIGAVAAWQDISERKRAELQIRQLNSELEQRVRDRTAQLEAANKELEAFSYSVSHDLRAPLRGIDGWSLALLEDYGDQLDAQARQYLDRVRTETQRMGLLIDDLLQLSRVTRVQMRQDPVDLSSLAYRVAGKVRENQNGRRIEFVVTPGLETAGDAGLLEVTLTNLFDNAVKFTRPRADARIEFGRSEVDGEVAFYVRDNGVGFDMAYADKLFGAFQRLHKTSEFPGTGIGLATVQRVVRRHGGRIWAESRPGDGATFFFTLGSRNEK